MYKMIKHYNPTHVYAEVIPTEFNRPCSQIGVNRITGIHRVILYNIYQRKIYCVQWDLFSGILDKIAGFNLWCRSGGPSDAAEPLLS